MQRFSFRLQTIERLRTHEENRRKEELAEARRCLIAEEGRLSRLHEQSNVYQSQLVFSQGEQLDMTDIVLVRTYLEELDRQIELQERQVEQAAIEVENRREVLVKVSQDRKVLEKLREKRYLDYRREANREEQIFLDEVAGRSSASERNRL
ncbi:MAG: flagellar export protein FliJ [Candidatus Latescibacteria bacterium]|nr:flagellar export protein FliJ [Candidatus Latescibacterota bacterium]